MKKYLILTFLFIITLLLILNPIVPLTIFNIALTLIIIIYPSTILLSMLLLLTSLFYKKNIIIKLAKIFYTLFYMGFLTFYIPNLKILYETKLYGFLILKILSAIILGIVLLLYIWRKNRFYPQIPLYTLILYLIGLFLTYYVA